MGTRGERMREWTTPGASVGAYSRYGGKSEWWALDNGAMFGAMSMGACAAADIAGRKDVRQYEQGEAAVGVTRRSGQRKHDGDDGNTEIRHSAHALTVPCASQCVATAIGCLTT